MRECGPMKLDLTRYRQPVSHFARTFQPGEVASDAGAYDIVAPVELEFDIHKDKDKFRLVGHLRTELELPCSRCLEPFRFGSTPISISGIFRRPQCRPIPTAKCRTTT